MTINPETMVVESSSAGGVHTFVGEREGHRWTIKMTDAELSQFAVIPGAAHGVNKARRREYLAQKMRNAMMGAPDA